MDDDAKMAFHEPAKFKWKFAWRPKRSARGARFWLRGYYVYEDGRVFSEDEYMQAVSFKAFKNRHQTK